MLDIKKKSILNNLNLSKKYYLLKKIDRQLFKLKKILDTEHGYKNIMLDKSLNKISKKTLLSYIVTFSFSPKNTLLHITDIYGNLKFRYSAGLVGISGKQKKNRTLVLSRFFNILIKIKITYLKNKPIALHLHNVGSYKYFIVKKLRNNLFIKVIKSYETYPYNGCRKKKRLHKRQRSKRKNG